MIFSLKFSVPPQHLCNFLSTTLQSAASIKNKFWRGEEGYTGGGSVIHRVDGLLVVVVVTIGVHKGGEVEEIFFRFLGGEHPSVFQFLNARGE